MGEAELPAWGGVSTFPTTLRDGTGLLRLGVVLGLVQKGWSHSSCYFLGG